MQSALRPLVADGLAADGTFLLLGYAANKLGNHEEALWFLEQVKPGHVYLEFERIIYCNHYAFALMKAGRSRDARAHVEKFDTAGWPREDREWASAVLRDLEPQSEPPELKPPKSVAIH